MIKGLFALIWTPIILQACNPSLSSSSDASPSQETLNTSDTTSKHLTRKLVFYDEFDRDETQNETDEVGNGWLVYQSPTGLKGLRSTDLYDGHLNVFRQKGTGHAVSLSHTIPLLSDGAFEVRFKFETEKDRLHLSAVDMKEKSVHTGHIIGSTYRHNSIQLIDHKAGIKDLKLKKKIDDGTLTDADKALLETRKTKLDFTIEPGVWNTLYYEFVGDVLTVSINGTVAGSLKSPGVAHATKSLYRMSVQKRATIDYIKVYSYN